MKNTETTHSDSKLLQFLRILGVVEGISFLVILFFTHIEFTRDFELRDIVIISFVIPILSIYLIKKSRHKFFRIIDTFFLFLWLLVIFLAGCAMSLGFVV